jgi:AcrR family transcriptional regulator
MATKQQAASAPGKRQAAYTARNRANLIRFAYEVLAEIGPTATVEQLATHAQVSPTTIYKYFANKEVLFAEALAQFFEEFIQWSQQTESPGEPLERVIDTGRKLFRIKQHNPILAQVLSNVLKYPQLAINAVEAPAVKVFKSLAKTGAVENEHVKERLILWRYAMAGIMTSLYVLEEISAEEADVAMGICLSVWGISEARGKEITSRKLVFPLHAMP